VPIAVIVNKESEANEFDVERKIRHAVGVGLSSYQRPHKYFFKDFLVSTPSGKIDKNILREEFDGQILESSLKIRAFRGLKK
jgi:acyl-CoA synthetase (AMP-forming)/AMP-acid ligase II